MFGSLIRGAVPQRNHWGLWVQNLKSSLFDSAIASHAQKRFASNGSHTFESVEELSRFKENGLVDPNVNSLPYGKKDSGNLPSATTRPYSLRSQNIFREICKLTQLEANQLAEECKNRMIAKPVNCLSSWKPVNVATRSLPFPHPGAIFSGMVVVPGVNPFQLLCPNVATSICCIAAAFTEKDT
eukprot:GHVS01102798.1.p1 GENE.GHVS01102798.1~~GHVS01102798.1.p1  ORF type:complete len:184 (+),score=5.18 GHVS01102798.1:85-636(+)